MRLICPSCQKPVTVPDTDAGKTTKCPECGHSFPAPELYSAVPSEPLMHLPPAEKVPEELPSSLLHEPAPSAPPPPLASSPPSDATPYSVEPEVKSRQPVPVAPPPIPAPRPEAPAPERASRALAASESALSPEGGRIRWLTISQHGVKWLPLVCLTLVFLLTFFKWVGAYPAGYKAYAQSPWQALFAVVSVDSVSNRVFQLEGPIDEKVRASMWLLPYLIFLLAALALTWAEHVFRWMDVQPPLVLQNVWRHRTKILIALTALTLFFLLLQEAVGFGLENAAYRVAEEKAAAISARDRGGAPSDLTPEEEQKERLRVAMFYGSLNMGGTFWLNLVVLAHLLALAGVVMDNWLTRRGKKPAPRIGLYW